MPLKKYIEQVAPRTVNKLNYQYDILSYDIDNAYPQRILATCQSSPTAKVCWDKRASYIEGDGFENDQFLGLSINEGKVSLNKLLHLHSIDKAIFKGIALHVNYNANYEITEVNYIRYEDVRICNPVSKRSGMYAHYTDWAHRTWKNMMPKYINYHFSFDPTPETILRQVDICGGWENYTGQIYYESDVSDDYQLAECDSVIFDIENEAGLQLFRNRSINLSFAPSVIISKEGLMEAAEDIDPIGQGFYNTPKETDRKYSVFQGAEAASSIMEIEYETGAAKPEITVFQPQNVDKLYSETTITTINNIIMGFSVPPDLILPNSKNGLSNGGEKKVAMREFNANTKRDRILIGEIYGKIFSLHINFKNLVQEYVIKPIQNEDVDEIIGVKAGAFINALLISPIAENSKINTLYKVYGIPLEDAKNIVQGNNLII